MNDSKRIIELALKTGKLLLVNGAETYRVEEAVMRMIESKHLFNTNVFVIPTGIILTCEDDTERFSYLERVRPEGIDLEIIDRTNDFSRIFSNGQLNINEAEVRIKSIENAPHFSKLTRFIFSGMAGGFFLFLLGGSYIELILAYIISSFTTLFYDKITVLHLNFFFKNILGGLFASALGLAAVITLSHFNITASLNTIIIGPLMVLVPGVPITNGIRDLISGELLSGSAKIMEALFTAIALAFGVGIILQLGINWI